ncbi:translocation/assembly module TamB domain-containing protein [Neisseria sp. Ec49-e6-T10]|uniref:translocation/assembly module TamB domain-containing protein n=1 Tax=Neisseria sp. Ec49-e6-T10 TaxID=3140744 RepID=UPI003EB8A921
MAEQNDFTVSTTNESDKEDSLTSTPTPPKRTKRHWLRNIIISFFVLLFIVVGVLSWVIFTPSGLRFAVFKVPAWFGVQIQASQLNGTISKGFNAQVLKVNTEAADVDISQLDFVWDSSKIWQRMVWVDKLSVGDVFVQTKPTEKTKDKQPLTIPKDIGLPVDVHIGKVTLTSLAIDQKDNKVLTNSALSYDYQNKQHHLVVDALNSPWAMAGADIKIDNIAPFALNGTLNTTSYLDETTALGKFSLSGNLVEPEIKGRMDGEGLALDLLAQLKPFEERTFKKVRFLRLGLGGFDPNQFVAASPEAKISMSVVLQPTEDERLSGQLIFANISPNFANNNGIPVTLAHGQIYLDRKGVLSVEELYVEGLKQGQLSLTGTVDLPKKDLNLKLALSKIQAQDFVQTNFNGQFDGQILATGTYQAPELNWQVASDKLGTQGKMFVSRNDKNEQSIQIAQAKLQAKAGGELNITGAIDLFGLKKIQLQANTQALNPKTILPDLPTGSVTTELKVDGQLAEPLTLNAKLALKQSQIENVPLNGAADIALLKTRLTRADVNINLGSNHIQTKGSFGTAQDKLSININAPNLAQAGVDISGSLNINGSVAGELKKLTIDLNAQARSLQYGKMVRLNTLDAKIKASPNINAPLNVTLDGKELIILGATAKENTQINFIRTNLNGTGAQHKLNLETAMNLGGNDYRANIAASGGLNNQYVWKGVVQTLDIKGAVDLLLQNTVQLEAAADHFSLGRANWSALGGSLSLDHLKWSGAQGISTKGSANHLQVGKLAKIVTVPFAQDLTLKGSWDVQYGSTLRGFANIEHQAGDIVLPVSKTKTRPLGIKTLVLNAQLQGSLIKVGLDAKTLFGFANGTVNLNRNSNNFSLSTLGGNIRLEVPDFSAFKLFVPIGTEVAGKLEANLGLGGSIAQPNLNGTINADNLMYRERNLGIRLINGSLRTRVSGQKLTLDSLKFATKRGTLEAKGHVQLVNNQPNIDIDVLLDRFNLFDRPNRVLVLSGNTHLFFEQAKGVELKGDLKVDFARIDLPKVGTPSLSDDVEVVGRPKEDTKALPIFINLGLDLNDRFRFTGMGLNVLLGGKMNVNSRPQEPMKAMGQVRVVEGRYKAYGQDLDIEKGVITFIGPIENPVLNIRAMRKLSPVGAGVEVTGPVSSPRINLVTSEPMSQKDKLAWLVLGRAAGGEQDDDALAASAGALLAGSINDKVGFFDELGISTRAQRNLKTGEVSPAEQVATVGKHLTKEFYVGYEYGLNTAESAVKISYQITRALQLIFRAGQDASSAEAKYTIRFD